MTDAEKFLTLMNALANENREKQKKEMDNMAMMTKDMYDSYLNAGFPPKQAMELTKYIIAAALNAPKK